MILPLLRRLRDRRRLARTAAGRALTAKQKRDQVKHAYGVLFRSKIAWNKFLDVEDLDASFPAWVLTMESIVQDGFQGSTRLAEGYLKRFAKAEGFNMPDDLPLPVLDQAKFTEVMLVNGPISIKQKIGKGLPPAAAKDAALERFLGAAQEQVMAGGRDFIIGASKYSGKRGRWRRVTDGEPCAFCAMLAGRGPVYTEDTVKFESHNNCGCTAEIVVGEWQPNEKEKLWRHSYNLAALDADDVGESRLAPSRRKKDQEQDNILWRMRRNAPELFSDGVEPIKL